MKKTNNKEKEGIVAKNIFKEFFTLSDDNFFSSLFSQEFILRVSIYVVLGMLAMITVYSVRVSAY